MLHCERTERETYTEPVSGQLAIIRWQGINSHAEVIKFIRRMA